VVVERKGVEALLGDPRLNSSRMAFVRMQGVVDGPVYDGVAHSLLALDGADHTRLRKLVSRAFTPRSIEVLRPSMRALAHELVDRFAASGRCEFMADFADHYPVQMICELLGVPRSDHEHFARWSNAMTWVLSFELAGRLDEVMRGFEGMSAYLERFIEERRRAPQDDLVTRLIQAEDGGDRLSPMELRTMIAGLLFAGYDTTRNQLGIAMALFCEHRDQWTQLAANPALAVNAVEEVLRFLGVIGVAPRIA